MKEAKKAIADCIAVGKTSEALELAKTHFPNLQNRILPLQGKFKKIENRFIAGAMEQEKFDTQSAGITYSLLELMSQSDEKSTEPPQEQSRIKRLITFKKEFLSDVIGEFSRSKYVLFGTLGFVIIVGIVSAIFITNIMPTTLGKTVLSITLISFFTLVISSLGFLNSQIKQFQGTKSFLKFEEYSNPND